MRKVFVEVSATFGTDGNITPHAIVWEDGTKYEIDKVIDKKNRASMKAGGLGLRYTCRIENQQAYIFYDGEKWFVEAKV